MFLICNLCSRNISCWTKKSLLLLSLPRRVALLSSSTNKEEKPFGYIFPTFSLPMGNQPLQFDLADNNFIFPCKYQAGER